MVFIYLTLPVTLTVGCPELANTSRLNAVSFCSHRGPHHVTSRHGLQKWFHKHHTPLRLLSGEPVPPTGGTTDLQGGNHAHPSNSRDNMKGNLVPPTGGTHNQGGATTPIPATAGMKISRAAKAISKLASARRGDGSSPYHSWRIRMCTLRAPG